MGDDAALVAAYLDHVRVEKRLAARTLALYTLDLQKLCGFAARAPSRLGLCDVRDAHVRRWVAQMHSAGRSGRGIALILSGWRGFYAWLGRQGRVPSNPVVDVRAPKSPKPLPKALAVDDAVQFADFHSDDDPWLEARDAAIVELLYGCGLRVAELVGLDVVPGPRARGWVDLEAGEVHVLGKGSKRRSVPLGSAARLALQRWLELRGPGGTGASMPVQDSLADASSALFNGRRGTRLGAHAIWDRLQRRSALAGTPAPVHPHMLRHSFASHVLQSSGDLRAVQDLLGHANITTTQVYTRLDFQHLASAYDAAHPRARRKSGR